MSALESSLAPIERYALRVRTEVDPFYSLYFRTEAQRREEVEAAGGDLDVDALEGLFDWARVCLALPCLALPCLALRCLGFWTACTMSRNGMGLD